MTKVLNSMGIIPDFYSYRFRLTHEDIAAHYGSAIQCNFITIPESTRPFEWNITKFNFDINTQLKGYDLIINSNNTSLGLNPSLNILSYVHYPRKARLMQKPTLKRLFDFGRDPLMLNAFRYHQHRRISSNDLQVANSAFTAQRFEKHYDHKVGHILYPPVDIDFKEVEKLPNRIVSLGRFSPNKRQLEQVKMMASLPGYELYLIGFKNDPAYFDRCADAVASLRLTNVHLVADASEKERNDLLTSATFFIHSLREEPFGITTVQGIGAGCLPIVHNSGGQREVVPYAELRYESEADIPELVQKLEKSEQIADLRTALKTHVRSYSSEAFREQFKSLLEQKLPVS